LLLETFLAHIFLETACIMYDMFTRESESARGLQFQLSSRERRTLQATQGHSQSHTL